MRTILIAAIVALCAAVAVPAVAHKGGKGKHKGHKPDVIALPNGFQPEGITTSKRHTFFVGSRATGAIYKGSLRSGQGDELVAGGDGKQATGLKVDRFGRLFVSGAGSLVIRVYDASTGTEIRNYPIADSGFINDVIVTKRGAYFTDSNNARLYHIPFGKQGALRELETITLSGEYVNGAAPGVGVISVVKLSRDLSRGFIARTITDERFDVPTTIARSGGRNYVVNAKFASPSPTTDTYQVVKVPKK
jgi:hypothetical protein